jgi:ribose transport system substrate-binding protein
MSRSHLVSFAYSILFVAFLAGGCDRGGGAGKGDRLRLGFVTNTAADFWRTALSGVRQGEKDFDVACEFKIPPDGTAADQQRIVEELMAKGVKGISISPNDSENQVDLINRVAKVMPVVCQDSDCPKSNRLCYVGTNNYKAGLEAGKLLKEVLPHGGKVMFFVGRMDAQNAIDRVNGIRKELEGSGIEILDIRTDLVNRAQAKANVEDAIAKHADLGCLVGIWAYNPPAILSAVKGAGKAGKIPILGFDEEDDTLQGVEDGHIFATIVQDPYQFGYRSIQILAAAARGRDTGVPAGKVVEIPIRVIRKDSVKEFREALKKQRAEW